MGFLDASTPDMVISVDADHKVFYLKGHSAFRLGREQVLIWENVGNFGEFRIKDHWQIVATHHDTTLSLMCKCFHLEFDVRLISFLGQEIEYLTMYSSTSI